MIDFPANPTVGQQFVSSGTTWVWDGVKWGALGVASSPGTEYLPLAGGVMEGPLTLAADPTTALEAATKEYVDSNTGAVVINTSPPLNARVGELWWDNVGGQLYIWYDDGSTQQWVIAVNSAIGDSLSIGMSPPGNPAVGSLWFDSVGAQLYIYYDDGNSQQWVPTTNQFGGGYLPLTGGSLTGPLAVPQGISAPNVIGDNRIINGDMRIDQRNNGASGTATNTYTIDRWQYGASQSGKGTWGRITAAPAGYTATGFPYNLSFSSSSAYTLVAADSFYFIQHIEADMVSDFQWGTANAQPVTLSFWASSSLTGTFSGAIVGALNYPFSYLIPVANTWTKIVLTIPGSTTGSWVMSGNAAGVHLLFELGGGANFRGPANVWTASTYYGVTGAQSIVSVNGAQINLTGVKLEIGSIATPFNRQSLAKSLADCQRYYQPVGGFVGGFSGATTAQASIIFSVPMRAPPTPSLLATVTNGLVTPGVNSYNLTGLISGTFTIYGGELTYGTAGAVVGQWHKSSSSYSSQIVLSAEL